MLTKHSRCCTGEGVDQGQGFSYSLVMFGLTSQGFSITCGSLLQPGNVWTYQSQLPVARVWGIFGLTSQVSHLPMPLYQSGFLVTCSKCLVIFGLTSQVSQLPMPLYWSGFLVTCSECLVIFGLTCQVSELPVSPLKPGIPSLSAILFPVHCLSPSSSGC